MHVHVQQSVHTGHVCMILRTRARSVAHLPLHCVSLSLATVCKGRTDGADADAKSTPWHNNVAAATQQPGFQQEAQQPAPRQAPRQASWQAPRQAASSAQPTAQHEPQCAWSLLPVALRYMPGLDAARSPPGGCPVGVSLASAVCALEDLFPHVSCTSRFVVARNKSGLGGCGVGDGAAF